MHVPAPLEPQAGSLILPGDQWRAVLTWKPDHRARLACYMPDYAPLHFSLGREPDNDVDRNAILVYDKLGAIGYLRSSVARWLARPLDRLREPVLVEGRIGRNREGVSPLVKISGRTTVLAFLRENMPSDE